MWKVLVWIERQTGAYVSLHERLKHFFLSCPNRKLGDGLFLQSCAEVAELYPKIKYENIIIDNCCMQVLELTQLTLSYIIIYTLYFVKVT